MGRGRWPHYEPERVGSWEAFDPEHCRMRGRVRAHRSHAQGSEMKEKESLLEITRQQQAKQAACILTLSRADTTCAPLHHTALELSKQLREIGLSGSNLIG